jgi:hypothetical protein
MLITVFWFYSSAPVCEYTRWIHHLVFCPLPVKIFCCLLNNLGCYICLLLEFSSELLVLFVCSSDIFIFFIVGVCILLCVLSNYKIKPSFATTSNTCFILCSLRSLHVSAFTRSHLQVITCKHKKHQEGHHLLQWIRWVELIHRNE